jgi:hypothetical protein
VRRVHFFIYMGDADTNDAVVYRDSLAMFAAALK